MSCVDQALGARLYSRMRTRGVVVVCFMFNVILSCSYLDMQREPCLSSKLAMHLDIQNCFVSALERASWNIRLKLSDSKVGNLKKEIMHHGIPLQSLNSWIKTTLSCSLLIILKCNANFFANCIKWFLLKLSCSNLHLCGTIPSQSAWKVYIVKTNNLALYCYLVVANLHVQPCSTTNATNSQLCLSQETLQGDLVRLQLTLPWYVLRGIDQTCFVMMCSDIVRTASHR